MPGVGGSMVVTKATRYLAERNYYPGGVLYINLSGINNVLDALATITMKLEAISGKPFVRKASLRRLTVEEVIMKLKLFYNTDNVDDLVKNDGQLFVYWINKMLDET
jgi:hypothetical protein